MAKNLLLLLALLLPCAAAEAAVDYVLMIDSIEGESARDGHEDEIDLRSISWGTTQSGRVACIEDFKVIKQADLGSPGLLMGQVRGTVYDEAVLTAIRRTGGEGGLEDPVTADIFAASSCR